MMKKLFASALALTMAFTLIACNGDTDTTDAQTTAGTTDAAVGETDETNGETYKIGVLAPAATHGWVAGVTYHAERRLEELEDQGQIDYQVYTSSNAEQMTGQLDDLRTWGAEAIVAFPQWEGMESPMQEAIDDGITVVNFDIEINAEGVYRVAGDNKDMGIRSAEYIVDKIGTEGTVIILDVPTSGSVAALRKQGFEETVAEIAPDLELHTYATQFTREDGLSDFSDILTNHSHIDAVFSMDDETSIGVVQAIEEADRDDIQVITGGGGSQEYFNMMDEYEDIWLQSALYSPDMVEDAVDMAVSILKGEDVEEVVIIPTAIVDRGNVENYLDPDSPY